jgi:hypothetical protein
MEKTQTQKSQRKGARRLPYQPPTMVAYGSVVNLTRGNM